MEKKPIKKTISIIKEIQKDAVKLLKRNYTKINYIILNIQIKKQK